MVTQKQILDLERARLKEAIPSIEDNREDLRKDYLDEYGFKTWRDWANFISGLNVLQKKDALYQAYGTQSSRDEFTNRFIDFLNAGGSLGGGYDFLNRDEMVQRLSSVNQDVMVDHNGTSTRDIQQGRCYLGDGVDDEVIESDLGDSLTTSQTITLCVKFAFTSANPGFPIAFGGNNPGGIEIETYNTGNMSFNVRNITDTAYIKKTVIAGTYDDDQIHSFILQFKNQNEIRGFIDNVDQGSVAYVDNLTSVASEFKIMARRVGGFFDNKVFDVRVFNKELSSAERAAYQNGEIIDGTIAWYKCDEQAGDIAYDSSGNENHGTITNATLSTFHSTQDIYSFQNQVGYSNYGFFDDSDTKVTSDLTTQPTNGLYEVSIRVDGAGGGNFGRVFDKNTGSGEVFLFYNPANTSKMRIKQWFSSVAGEFDFDVTPDVVQDIKFYYDNSSSDNRPIVYVNGVQKTITVNSTPSGDTLTNTDAFVIGNRGSDNIRGWDGLIFDLKVTDLDTNTVVLDMPLNEGNTLDIQGGTVENVTSDEFWIAIPRDESNTDYDVLAEDLQYTGKAKLNADLVSSNCIKGDGVDDYVALPVLGLTDTEVTLSAWVYRNSANTGYIISGRDGGVGGFSLILESSGVVTFIYGTTGQDSSNTALPLNEWTYVSAVYDGSSVKYYFNGTPDGEDTSITGTFTASTNYFLMARGDGVGGATVELDGSLADCRLIQSALSDSDILSLYINSYTGSSVAHYPCAEGAGTTIHDVSGNENHGTATNITESTFWTTQDEYHYNITEGFSGNNNYIINSAGIENDGTDWDGWSNNLGATESLIDVSEEFGIPGATAIRLQYTYTGLESNFLSPLQRQTEDDTFTGGEIALLSYYIKGTYSYASGVFVNERQVDGETNAGSYVETPISERATDGSVVTISEWTRMSEAGDISSGTVGQLNTKFFQHTNSNKPQAGDYIDIQIFGVQLEKVESGVTTPTSLIPTTTEFVKEGTYIPADQSNPTKDVYGNDLTNPACCGHNNAETCIEQPLAPSLIQADADIGYWYNHNTSGVEAIERCYADILLDQGSELVTNGDFSSATGWTLTVVDASNQATISGGQLRIQSTGANIEAKQNVVVAGKKYKVRMDVESITSGDGRVFLGVDSTGSNYAFSTAGIHEFEIDATVSGNMGIKRAGTPTDFLVNSISIKELTATNNIGDQIFADISGDPTCKKNIISYDTAQTSTTLDYIKDYLNIP